MKHARPTDSLSSSNPLLKITVEPKGGIFKIANLSGADLEIIRTAYEELFPGRDYTQAAEMVDSHYPMPGPLTFKGRFQKASEAIGFVKAINGFERDPLLFSKVANSIDNLSSEYKRANAQRRIDVSTAQSQGKVKPARTNEHELG